MTKNNTRLNDHLATLIISLTWLILIANLIITTILSLHSKSVFLGILGLITTAGLSVNLWFSYQTRTQDRRINSR